MERSRRSALITETTSEAKPNSLCYKVKMYWHEFVKIILIQEHFMSRALGNMRFEEMRFIPLHSIHQQVHSSIIAGLVWLLNKASRRARVSLEMTGGLSSSAVSDGTRGDNGMRCRVRLTLFDIHRQLSVLLSCFLFLAFLVSRLKIRWNFNDPACGNRVDGASKTVTRHRRGIKTTRGKASLLNMCQYVKHLYILVQSTG